MNTKILKDPLELKKKKSVTIDKHLLKKNRTKTLRKTNEKNEFLQPVIWYNSLIGHKSWGIK